VSLSKLDLVGFKSFMSPVSLHFGGGITAILGPNGCGKTNIVDAVRWVLGEQSARQLRGSKMENVIFNGTEVHKPMGYAMVNLTVNNVRGVFPIDYSEIMITRKVYRSGVSEYFINKSPCRLKDIRELFADTGTGSHSYSVIELEMIDDVLDDTHGDRRLMFEEASGIVKYRMRREEAERKLKLTETDLVRLEDILEELGKNVRSLRYQMGKAKRYKTTEERIRNWELIQLRKNLTRLLTEKHEADAKLADTVHHSQRESKSLSQMERKVEKAKVDLLDIEKRNTELQNNRYEIRRKIQISEEKVIQFTERQSEATRRIERASHEIEEAEGRLTKLATEVSGASSECETLSARIIDERTGVKGLHDAFKEISGRMDFLRERLIELKQTQLDFLQDHVRVKSSIEHFESILSELDSRAAETRELILEIERESKSLETEKENVKVEISELTKKLHHLENERDRTRETVSDLEGRMFERENLLSEKRTELARLKSRRDLVVRMKENFEGYQGGARYVLKKGDERVRGPLAEFLAVDERFRPPLEAVLGGMLDGLVVDSMDSALNLVEELTAKNMGKVRFFFEESEKNGERRSVTGIDGCLGPLSSHVRIEDSKRSLIENILGHVYVFNNTDGALQFMSSDIGGPFSAVTLSGIYFERNKGVYYTGSSADEISMLGRAEEIERMDAAVSTLEDELSRLEDECDASRHEKQELVRLIGELEGEGSKIREEHANRIEGRQEIERNYISKKEKCSILLTSLDEMEHSRMDILSKLEETKLALEMQQEGGEVTEVKEVEAELATLQEKRDELEAELTEKRVELASLEGELEKKKEVIRGCTAMEKQFRSLIEQRQQEIANAETESALFETELEAERSQVHELLEYERSYEQDLEELRQVLEERRNEISVGERELKAKHAERERFLTMQNEFRITLSSIGTRMKDLIDRGNEIYGADLSCYLSDEEIPLSPEEEHVTPEMLEKEKRKLESLGPVNLAAVEEYEEKKNRFEFLTSQKEDLMMARDELHEAIRKINRRARKQFIETFDVVKNYFAETFRILFEGGEADLSLSDGADPLEADIVIKARPKGKRLQDISLLSGGERALTALALLFALYKAKPSPFCIFDEVDAPLDDANIQRFIRMLRKFEDDTQFIIITHNKRTMEVASSLYGVTMEERGVSRVVSVDLPDIEEILSKRKPAEERLVESPVSPN